MVVLDLTADDRRHLARALDAHARWCRANGHRLPVALEQLRSVASSGQSRPDRDHGDDSANDDGMTAMPLLVSYAEAGRRLDVSERSIRRLVAEGALPVVDVGSTRRIAVSDLAEFVEHRRAEALQKRVTL